MDGVRVSRTVITRLKQSGKVIRYTKGQLPSYIGRKPLPNENLYTIDDASGKRLFSVRRSAKPANFTAILYDTTGNRVLRMRRTHYCRRCISYGVYRGRGRYNDANLLFVMERKFGKDTIEISSYREDATSNVAAPSAKSALPPHQPKYEIRMKLWDLGFKILRDAARVGKMKTKVSFALLTGRENTYKMECDRQEDRARLSSMVVVFDLMKHPAYRLEGSTTVEPVHRRTCCDDQLCGCFCDCGFTVGDGEDPTDEADASRDGSDDDDADTSGEDNDSDAHGHGHHNDGHEHHHHEQDQQDHHHPYTCDDTNHSHLDLGNAHDVLSSHNWGGDHSHGLGGGHTNGWGGGDSHGWGGGHSHGWGGGYSHGWGGDHSHGWGGDFHGWGGGHSHGWGEGHPYGWGGGHSHGWEGGHSHGWGGGHSHDWGGGHSHGWGGVHSHGGGGHHDHSTTTSSSGGHDHSTTTSSSCGGGASSSTTSGC